MYTFYIFLSLFINGNKASLQSQVGKRQGNRAGLQEEERNKKLSHLRAVCVKDKRLQSSVN